MHGKSQKFWCESHQFCNLCLTVTQRGAVFSLGSVHGLGLKCDEFWLEISFLCYFVFVNYDLLLSPWLFEL